VDPQRIILPMAALAGLTFVVLFRLPFVRIRAGLAQRITPEDFKLGESERVPPDVAIANRALVNLLEMPVLFYVGCLALYVTGHVDDLSVTLAWIYVALRVVHTLVHLTYNKVFHRLFVFAASCAVLAAIWVRLTLAVL
jgi:hypothetical protein